MTPQQPAYFVHISDTHFGPTQEYDQYKHVPYTSVQRLVKIINELPTRPDFVIHTGDVATHPNPAAYELAQTVFAELQCPIYYVTGNHDTANHIRTHLPMGPKTDLGSEGALSYAFEAKGYRFLVLDARGPDEIDPHGLLSAEQMAILQSEVESGGPPLTLFLHFPALPINSTWMDKNMLILNGEAFHQALFPVRSRLRGVFHGHIHQHTQVLKDGILYVGVASAVSQFMGWPEKDIPEVSYADLPGYNFVHLLPEQTIVHQHSFARPD